MLLKRFYDEQLAQASYLIGCSHSGTALVIDPNRDIEQYVTAAAAEGLRITHVTETHIHADFVSGSRELAQRTGATLLLSAEGGPDWQYTFAASASATLLRDGNQFEIGYVHIDVLHTPGHTPEHLTFLVTDTAGASQPMGAFTGDFVFVGDVGRPDLLERAARVSGTMESSARELYRSLQRLKALPDYLQLWPGHGAGSACGKALGAVPQTTLGYEKLFNWAFTVDNEAEFVRMVLAGQPEPPTYFAEMKRVNKAGPRIVGGIRHPERLPASRLSAALADNAVLVDTRHAADFAESHIPGSWNISLGRSFSTWMGWLIPYDRDIYLLVDDDDGTTRIDRATHDLMLIGLDRVVGYFGEDAITTWKNDGQILGHIPQITAVELQQRMTHGDVQVVDVRRQDEWDQGHLHGASHVPVGYLLNRLADLPLDRPLVVHCQGGTRSAIAASLLHAKGHTQVMNYGGGFAEWQQLSLPVERVR